MRTVAVRKEKRLVAVMVVVATVRLTAAAKATQTAAREEV